MIAVSVHDRRRGTNGGTAASSALLAGVMQIAEIGMLSHTDADAAGKTQRREPALPKRRKLRMLSYRLSQHRQCRHLCQVRSYQTRIHRGNGGASWGANAGDETEVGVGNEAEGRPAQGAAQGAAAEILASTHEGTLLLRALARPAAETMNLIPGKAADRVAPVLCGALRRVVDSQLAYVKKPTVAGRAEAAKAHRWLWVLPTRLLCQCQKKRIPRH